MERRFEDGLLQPLHTLERPRSSVSMDFISGFPTEGDATVIVVVDRFLKYALFSAAPHECPAELVADLFVENVVKHLGVPTYIVSDRDARFTGKFSRCLLGC